MTVKRGFLYFGVFLVAVGGVTLLAETGAITPEAIAAALGWWPLAIIAIGVGLVLRRTPAALPGGMLAAATPGLLLGGMLVSVPDLPTPCTDLDGAAGPVVTREGSFGSSSMVDLELSCGDLEVSTAPGSAWRMDVRDGGGRETVVTDTADGLRARSGEERQRFSWDTGPVAWDVVVPTTPALKLAIVINAGRGELDLAGANLDRLGLDLNAGDARVDLGDAVVRRLDMDINAAAARVTLPATGNVEGDLNVNAGSLDLCAPDDLGLRVRGEAALGSLDFHGLIQRGDAWETPNYSTAKFRADLSVSASVGSVDINPEGGCK